MESIKAALPPETMQPLFVSQIKLFGVPIIAPFMNEKKRAEMRTLREKAVEVECRLAKKLLPHSDLHHPTDSHAASETEYALPEIDSASNKATTSSASNDASLPSSGSIIDRVPAIEIFSPSDSTRTVSALSSNLAPSHSSMSEPTDFSKLYQSFPPLDSVETTIEGQLCFRSELNSSGSVELNMDLTASSVGSPHRPHDLSLVENIRAPNVSLVSPGLIDSAERGKRLDFKKCFRDFLAQKLAELDPTMAWRDGDTLTDFADQPMEHLDFAPGPIEGGDFPDLPTDTSDVPTPASDLLEIPALVRQNSYTLLEGPSPLIMAHLEKNKPTVETSTPNSVTRNSYACLSTNHSPRCSPRRVAGRRSSSQDSASSNRSPALSTGAGTGTGARRRGSSQDSVSSNRSSALSAGAGLRRRGWDLDRARAFWSSNDALDRMFAMPRARTATKATKPRGRGKTSVAVLSGGNVSLPASGSPSPVKSLRRTTAFGSLDALPSPAAARPIRRSLFGPAAGRLRSDAGPAASSANCDSALDTSGRCSTDPPPPAAVRRSSRDDVENEASRRNVAGDALDSPRLEKDSPHPPCSARNAVGAPNSAQNGNGSSSSPRKSIGLSSPRREVINSPRGGCEVIGSPRGSRNVIGSPRGSRDVISSPRGSRDVIGSPRESRDVIGCTESELERLQREHHRQMALLVERHRADQERMRRDFAEQERKLLGATRLAAETDTDGGGDGDLGGTQVSTAVPMQPQCARIASKESTQENPAPAAPSQRALVAARNSHNAREEEALSWEKENVCDWYASSELSSVTPRSGGRRGDHAFRVLHMNGQTTAAATTVSLTESRSSEGTVSVSSEGSVESCSSWRLRRNTPTADSRIQPSDREKRAASVIVAAARGFLVRRLLRTAHVRDIRTTIRDVTLATMQLHQENQHAVKPEDVELGRRFIHQLNASWLALYETFFGLSTTEQLALISADRARSSARSTSSTSLRRLSSATQRSLRRKQAGSTSPTVSRSSSRPSSAVSLVSRNSNGATPRLRSRTSLLKPWR